MEASWTVVYGEYVGDIVLGQLLQIFTITVIADIQSGQDLNGARIKIHTLFTWARTTKIMIIIVGGRSMLYGMYKVWSAREILLICSRYSVRLLMGNRQSQQVNYIAHFAIKHRGFGSCVGQRPPQHLKTVPWTNYNYDILILIVTETKWFCRRRESDWTTVSARASF